MYLSLYRLRVAHLFLCMFDNIQSVPEDIQDYVPHDCTNAPANGKAFCLAHCSKLEEMGIPTGLREFIQWCGASTVNFNKEGKSKGKVHKPDFFEIKASLRDIYEKLPFSSFVESSQ